MTSGYKWMAAVVVAISACAAMGEPSLVGVRLGEYAAGPKLTVNDLKGRVVLFEYWGVNCGPCIANIPHITQLQKKYPRERFIVVANHCQGGSASNAGAVWLSHAHDDVVSVINQGGLPDSGVRGIPYCFLFDATGKLVYQGSPASVDPAVDKAVKSSPGFLVAGRDFKVLRSEAMALGALRSNLSSTIKRLRTTAADEKSPGKDEAKYMLDQLTQWSDSEYAKATAEPMTDPLEVQELVQKMTALLRGDEMGDRWVELEKKLRTDKSFDQEIRAAKVLNAMEDMAQRSSVLGATKVSESQLARDKAGLKAQLQELIKRYPDTSAAKKAHQYIIDWKL